MRSSVELLPPCGSSVQSSGTRKRGVTAASTRKFTSRRPIVQLVRSSTSTQRGAPIIAASSGTAQSGPSLTCSKKRCSRR